MGIWVDILKRAASGDADGARELLNHDLQLALRYPSMSAGDSAYKGPLADRVAGFIRGLPASEQETARGLEPDLVNAVLASLVAQVFRSVRLLEFCWSHPEFAFDQVAELFSEWEGKKRSKDDRRKELTDLLSSMLSIGVPLPRAIANSLGSEGRRDLDFNEIGLAKRWNVGLAWLDFKRRQRIGGRYKAIDDSPSESDPEQHSEGIDPGMIPEAEVSLALARFSSWDTDIDFAGIGRELGPEITGIMEHLDREKPTHGFRPIAWHRSFWTFLDQYSPLEMELRTEDPECESDDSLVSHIAENYADVVKPNRLKVCRRRGLLEKACKGLIFERLVGSGRLNNPDSRSHRKAG